VGLILVFIFTGIANAAGVEGVFLDVPILMLTFNYTSSEAIRVIYCITFGGMLGSYLTRVRLRQKENHKPVIDYDVALICVPLVLVSVNAGVLLNRILPPVVTLIGLFGILILTLRWLNRFYKEVQKKKRLTQVMPHAEPPQPPQPTVQVPQTISHFRRESAVSVKSSRTQTVHVPRERLDPISLNELEEQTDILEFDMENEENAQRNEVIQERVEEDEHEENRIEKDKVNQDSGTKESLESIQEILPVPETLERVTSLHQSLPRTEQVVPIPAPETNRVVCDIKPIQKVPAVLVERRRTSSDLSMRGVVGEAQQGVIAEIWKQERRLFPKEKYFAFCLLLAVIVMIALFRGSGDVNSIVGIGYCSAGFWLLYAAIIPVTAIFYIWAVYFEKKRDRRKLQARFPMDQDFRIFEGNIPILSKASLIVGFCSGTLGIGGGLRLIPAMRAWGLSWLTGAATSSFIVLFSSFLSTFLVFISGSIQLAEMIFYIIMGFLAAFVLARIITIIIRKFNRQSALIIILMGLCIAGLIILPVLGIYRSIADSYRFFDSPADDLCDLRLI